MQRSARTTTPRLESDPWGNSPDPMCAVEHLSEQVTDAAEEVGLGDRVEYFVRFVAGRSVRDHVRSIQEIGGNAGLDYLFS